MVNVAEPAESFIRPASLRRSVPSLWPLAVEVVVPWRDVDAAGHVNNAVYLSYLETARIQAWFRAKGIDPATVREPLGELDLIFAHVSVDYRSQARFGETLVVAVRPGRVGETSFQLLYEVRCKEDGRLVAEAESVQVCWDWERQAKKRVAEDVRGRLGAT